jgi:hypothetical protein
VLRRRRAFPYTAEHDLDDALELDRNELRQDAALGQLLAQVAVKGVLVELEANSAGSP